MPLGVWEVAWDLARCETAFQDSGEPDRVRAESQAGGRLCLWRSQGYLGLVSWTRGRVGWRHAFQLPGQGRGQQSKDLLPVPTCAPQLWALCYLVDALSSSGLFSLQVSIVFILARTITTALLRSILFLFP